MRLLVSFLLILTFSNHIMFGGHPLLKGTDAVSIALIEDVIRFPKSLELINKATSEGLITLSLCRDSSMPFEAMWQSDKRKITLDGMKKSTWGCLIRDLIFELHNAVTTSEDAALLQKARYGTISCDLYVQGVEKIEHRNVIKTARLVLEGIKAGVFPKDARWDVVHDFDLHYKIQQLSGHSDTIVEEYKHYCPERFYASPYRGTIAKKRSQWENQNFAAELYQQYLRS